MDVFPIAHETLTAFCARHGYTFEFERDTWDGKEVAQIEIDGLDDGDDFICLLTEEGSITMTEFNLDGVTDEFRANVEAWADTFRARIKEA